METIDVDGECSVVRGWTWMGDVVWFVDGARWGMCVFVDGEWVCSLGVMILFLFSWHIVYLIDMVIILSI